MGAHRLLNKTRENRFLLGRIARISADRPWHIIGIAILLAILSVSYTVRHLDFKTSRNSLISLKEPAVNRYNTISKNFGRLTNALVVVEGLDLNRMKDFIIKLAATLERDTTYFQNLIYRIDTSTLDGKKLLYLTLPELDDLKRKLIDYGELIEELSFSPEISIILRYINQKISEATVSHLISAFIGTDKEQAETTSPPDTQKEPVDLSFLRSLLEQMHWALGPEYRFHSPWDTFFNAGSEFSEDGFLTSKDGRFAYMILDLRKHKGGFTNKRISLKRLRNHIRSLARQYPGLKVGVTGEVALATDEMKQALRDTLWATGIALAGIGLLFMFVFRQSFNPLLVIFSLVLSICWAFGWLTLTVGHLTILSVAFTPILLGLGVDFGIHILARYLEEKENGLEFSQVLQQSFQYTGKAVSAGGLTTALAFFAVMLADFRGIQELGFIAGSGVLLSLLSTFTVLPALLSLTKKRKHSKGWGTLHLNRPLGILGRIHSRPKTVVMSALFITVLSLIFMNRVFFDYNLLNLQAKGTESVVWEKKILNHSQRSSWFAITTADSLEEVRRKEERFKSLPAVRKVRSIEDLIPENQEIKIPAVLELESLIMDYDFIMEDLESVDVPEITEIVDKIRFKLRTEVKWDPKKKPAETEILLTREALARFTHSLKQIDGKSVKKRLTRFQDQLFQDFSKKFKLLRDNVQPSGPVVEDDIPANILKRFKGQNGQYLLRIYSKENIWNKEPMETFVNQLRSIEPNITGSPIVGYLSIHQMKKGYLQGGCYAIAAVVVILLILFRKLKETGLALIPLAFTIIWTLGWMGEFGISFNLANVIALPLLLGIVVDDGIHVVHRFREQKTAVDRLVTNSTAQAISLTSWTTMVGFGSLLISRHFGIFSLGLLITVAVGTAWILSLILLPVVLNYIAVKK